MAVCHWSPSVVRTNDERAQMLQHLSYRVSLCSQDTIDEMKEERIAVTNPEAAERVMKHRAAQQNPLAAAGRIHISVDLWSLCDQQVTSIRAFISHRPFRFDRMRSNWPI